MYICIYIRLQTKIFTITFEQRRRLGGEEVLKKKGKKKKQSVQVAKAPLIEEKTMYKVKTQLTNKPLCG